MNTKQNSQAFACLETTNHTVRMDIVEIRRQNLRAYFSHRSIPQREKSYISQLLSGKAAFGEKAARRLETTYGMPPMFLDGNWGGNEPQKATKAPVYPAAKNAEEAALLLAYRKKTRSEQRMILKALDIDIDQDLAKSA